MTKFRAAAAVMFFSSFLLATASDTSAAPGFDVLHSFTGTTADGAFPSAAIIKGRDGDFYGTTKDGGTSDKGTIFRMNPAGTITVLYNFTGGADGNGPMAALIQANDGNFYGTTYDGGGLSLGTVFRMTPAGALTIIHSFVGGTDGANPRAALIQASDGNLYGTTQFGGIRGAISNRGTIFGMTLDGAPVFQYAFSGALDGAYPYAPLIQARNGALYGTVYAGDQNTLGRVFRVTGSTITVVHTFSGGAGDGANPEAALVEGSDGNFYGTTHFGGAFNLGTAYRMAPSGAVTVLASFSGGVEGANPDSALVQLRDGNFYGTARVGTSLAHGTVFVMGPSGGILVLHTFTGSTDGATAASPLFYAAGKLYGTTVDGGAGGKGVVYRIDTNIGGATNEDFDADGKADVSVFRPSNNRWFYINSSNGTNGSRAWGDSASGDVPIPGDFDGDGTSDLAVYRQPTGEWFILTSSSNFTTFTQTHWGTTGDQPVPADYDGDGKTDLAVYRPSNGVWYVILSTTGSGAVFTWGGASGDVPAPADFDGDGRADPTVFRPSTGEWFVFRSATATGVIITWGINGDVPVPGDYDGDGVADIAIYRPSAGEWYVIKSSTGTVLPVRWGIPGDVAVPSDYDGDGRTDIVLYRPSGGYWFILRSSTNFASYSAAQWGVNPDVPIVKK